MSVSPGSPTLDTTLNGGYPEGGAVALTDMLGQGRVHSPGNSCKRDWETVRYVSAVILSRSSGNFTMRRIKRLFVLIACVVVHDRIVGVRDDCVEELWEVQARGKVR